MGDSLFLTNSNAEMIPVNSQNTSNAKPRCNHSEKETCINCIDYKKKGKVEEKSTMEKLVEKSGLTLKCSHGVGQKCLHCMQTPSYKGELKYNCQHGASGRCPNCVDKEYISDAKHKSFDRYLSENKEKCKGIHDESSKCNNCLPPQELVFKMNPNCSYHAPYPEGMCNKCMPPNAQLKRQVYRHVDYVSFMNQEELNIFVGIWLKGYCMKQRMGWLFGYYASDPNYPVS